MLNHDLHSILDLQVASSHSDDGPLAVARAPAGATDLAGAAAVRDAGGAAHGGRATQPDDVRSVVYGFCWMDIDGRLFSF